MRRVIDDFTQLPGKYIEKYSFVNRAIILWNQMPAKALKSLPCKSHIFRRSFREVIISEEK